jgi:signal transduction histidine kinase
VRDEAARVGVRLVTASAAALGLAISRAVGQAMGYGLSVRSTGEGSTFSTLAAA